MDELEDDVSLTPRERNERAKQRIKLAHARSNEPSSHTDSKDSDESQEDYGYSERARILIATLQKETELMRELRLLELQRMHDLPSEDH